MDTPSLNGRVPLLLCKEGHFYLFIYRPGNERNLFFALLQAVKNRCVWSNLTAAEVANVIRMVARTLEKGFEGGFYLKLKKGGGWEMEKAIMPEM